jgi:hypothetical protein
MLKRDFIMSFYESDGIYNWRLVPFVLEVNVAAMERVIYKFQYVWNIVWRVGKLVISIQPHNFSILEMLLGFFFVFVICALKCEVISYCV